MNFETMLVFFWAAVVRFAQWLTMLGEEKRAARVRELQRRRARL